MTIKQVQQQLTNLGIYKGGIDGVMGPITKEAIRNFQRLYPPLVPDGILGKATLAVMFPSKIEDRQGVDNLSVEAIYGPVGTNQVDFHLPYAMKLAWDPRVVINKFLCHRKIKDNLENIFTETLDYYTLEGVKTLRLDLFGGCLNIRKMRGGTKQSMHSYGIAVDIDPANNQLTWKKDKASLAKKEYDKFWSIVEKHGGYSLGRLKNYDWMHFQFVKP